MKLVIDTNVIISALLKNSVTREILLFPSMEFLLPAAEIEDNLTKAHKIIGGIDPFDVPFVALALSIENDGIWSNDKHFENLKGMSSFSENPHIVSK